MAKLIFFYWDNWPLNLKDRSLESKTREVCYSRTYPDKFKISSSSAKTAINNSRRKKSCYFKWYSNLIISFNRIFNRLWPINIFLPRFFMILFKTTHHSFKWSVFDKKNLNYRISNSFREQKKWRRSWWVVNSSRDWRRKFKDAFCLRKWDQGRVCFEEFVIPLVLMSNLISSSSLMHSRSLFIMYEDLWIRILMNYKFNEFSPLSSHQ